MKKRRIRNKIVVLSILGLFCAGAIAGIWLTISEYRTFRDGESVQATVTNVRIAHRRKGGSYIRLDTTIVLDGTTVRKVFRVPTHSFTVGDVSLLGGRQQYKSGSLVEVLAVKKGSTYEFAIADDVLNPWTELAALTGFLIMGVFAFVVLARRKNI